MFRFVSVFVASFFLSIHFGTILYVNSSLLGKFFEPETVSLFFLFGALGTILLFLFAPKLIEQFGKRLILFFFLVLTAANTFSLALASTSWVVALSFIVYATFLPMIFYCLDIFLEELSLDTGTGEIRGAYLTFVNLGIALGPFIIVILAKEDIFRPIYLTALFLLIPPILLALFSFKSQFPKKYEPYHHSPRLPFKLWWRNRNVRQATLARLTLEFFFAFMVIYTPIYLYSSLGFEWSELGFIFTIMLLPFVLL